MKRWIGGTAAALWLVATAGLPAQMVKIRIETSRGNIEATLDSVHAPKTVANFLHYVDARAYDSAQFHRMVRADNQPRDSVKIAVIQGSAARRPGMPRDSTPPVELERTNQTGLKHLDGTLSMARGGPNSATNQFFICIGPQPALDFGGHRNLDGQGFAAFGQVTKGMDVVRAINGLPVDTTQMPPQMLMPPITILRIVRVK